MTLECINPKDLPDARNLYPGRRAHGKQVGIRLGQQPEDVHGSSLAMVISGLRRACVWQSRRALAAAGARPEQVCKSRSTSSITTATNTCRSSKRPR